MQIANCNSKTGSPLPSAPAMPEDRDSNMRRSAILEGNGRQRQRRRIDIDADVDFDPGLATVLDCGNHNIFAWWRRRCGAGRTGIEHRLQSALRYPVERLHRFSLLTRRDPGL